MLHHLAVALGMLALSTLPALSARPPVVQTCFTPSMDCTAVIVESIDKAKKEVLVQAYAFTSCPIIQAIGRAKERNLTVRVLLDRSNEWKRYVGAIAYLREHGIEPKIDHETSTKSKGRGIAHIKAVIIDRRVLLTGSFNFSKSAQDRNVENLLIVRRRQTVREHLLQFEVRENGSRPAKQTINIPPACST